MQRDELRIGHDYYTASDEAWAAGWLGGRMRVTHLDPPEAGPITGGRAVRCDRLTPDGMHIMERHCIVFLDGIRGTWDEVGKPIYVAHLQREADAKAAAENAEAAAVAVCAETWMRHNIAAIPTMLGDRRYVALTPEALSALLDLISRKEGT